MTHQSFDGRQTEGDTPFHGGGKTSTSPESNGYEEEGCEEGEEGDQEKEVSQRLTIRTRFLGGLRAPFFYALTTPRNGPFRASRSPELYLD